MKTEMTQFINILPGDTAPHFRQRCAGNPAFNFDTTAGRYLVLCFLMSAADAHGRAAYAAARQRPDLFDDKKAMVFSVSVDGRDEKANHLPDHFPGYRTVWDADGSVCRLYGAMPVDSKPGDSNVPSRRIWVVVDPTLRVLKIIPFAPDQSDIAELIAYLDALPPPPRFAGFEIAAPILVLPQVFEPELCQQLVALYEQHGGEESGFMREVGGKTVTGHDHSHKRRKDHVIDDPKLIAVLQGKIKRRIVPQILKAHQFEVTRMERYLVGCYTAEDGGHFSAHRDNTTKGTAHRRFAVSINLNSDFDGGEVSFPEYSPRGYKPPPGGAVVFSCSLLHAVSKVTRGQRYAFLPFLYDEKAAALRESNNQFLGEGVGEYKKS
jgi:predicted 2-oxoglutarate/Fe(II)-dependent dioxygenase YbiX/peroxiredoxin